jgi:hypothetical protein
METSMAVFSEINNSGDFLLYFFLCVSDDFEDFIFGHFFIGNNLSISTYDSQRSEGTKQVQKHLHGIIITR